MKVAISGAGVAGPTLAYWLDRSGVEVTLIEKAPGLRTGGYMIDFWGLGYTIAERMGILAEVRRIGYSIKEVRLVKDNGRPAASFSAAVFGRMTNDRYISLPRGDLAGAIYRTIEHRVETLFDDSISTIEEHDTGLRVTLEKGGAREFDLVVGADGLHSNVREQVFGPEQPFERDLGYRVAAFQVPGYRPRDDLVYVSHSTPGRQIARFSQSDDLTMFLFVFVPTLMTAPEPHDLAGRKAVLRNVFGDVGWECPEILAAMDAVDDIYFDRVSQIRMDSWSKRRVALIGDAAACVSLLAGEGTGLAMVEAYVLAGELKRAGGDHRQAFQRQQETLRPFIAAKQQAAENFASAFAPKTALGLWVRNQATKLLGIPPLADILIGRSVRDDFDLPDYGM